MTEPHYETLGEKRRPMPKRDRRRSGAECPDPWHQELSPRPGYAPCPSCNAAYGYLGCGCWTSDVSADMGHEAFGFSLCDWHERLFRTHREDIAPSPMTSPSGSDLDALMKQVIEDIEEAERNFGHTLDTEAIGNIVYENLRAHDRPSGSGLREAVEQVLPRLSHWPKDAPGTGWNVDTEPHSEMCPPCALRTALSGSSDPEPGTECPICPHWMELHNPDGTCGCGAHG